MMAEMEPKTKYIPPKIAPSTQSYKAKVIENPKQESVERKVIENPNQNSDENSIAFKNSVKNKINKISKDEFENLFSINSEKETIEFIENYKLTDVENYIDQNIVFPESHLIVIINTKKSLFNLIGGKRSNLEYDFSETLFMKMCDTINKFSENLNTNDASKISLNNEAEIYKSLNLYTFNKNLEFFGKITEKLTKHEAESFYLPLMKKCLQNTSNIEECNLLNVLSQLPKELRLNINTSVKNLECGKSNFYIKETNLPKKRKFYRILFFSGSISELINVSKLEDILLEIKNEYNVVFNYFLYEHDYQYEKNIFPVLLRNNLLDDKNRDFDIFLKKEIIENQGFINHLTEKISMVENSLKEFFSFFIEIKKSFFKKQNFLVYQKKYDVEYANLMLDYEIINKNKTKYYEYTKAKINNQQVENIKKSFNEMNNSRVINKLLLNVKNSFDFEKYNDLLKEMISQSDLSFEKLTNDMNNLLISITKKDMKCDFYFEKINYLLALIDFMKNEFIKIKSCELIMNASANQMENMTKLNN